MPKAKGDQGVLFSSRGVSFHDTSCLEPILLMGEPLAQKVLSALQIRSLVRPMRLSSPLDRKP